MEEDTMKHLEKQKELKFLKETQMIFKLIGVIQYLSKTEIN